MGGRLVEGGRGRGVAGLGVVEAGDGPGVGAEPAREEGVEGRPRGVAALAAVDAEALDEAANTVNTRSPSRLPSRLLSRVPSRFPSRFPGRFPRDWRHLASGSRRRRALRRSRCPAIRRPSRAGPYPSLNQGDGFCVWRGPAQRETRRLRPTPRLAPPPHAPACPHGHGRGAAAAHRGGGDTGAVRRRYPSILPTLSGRSNSAPCWRDMAMKAPAAHAEAVSSRRSARLRRCRRCRRQRPARATGRPGDKAGEAGRESWRGLRG